MMTATPTPTPIADPIDWSADTITYTSTPLWPRDLTIPMDAGQYDSLTTQAAATDQVVQNIYHQEIMTQLVLCVLILYVGVMLSRIRHQISGEKP
jgi:hypothetical protein